MVNEYSEDVKHVEEFHEQEELEQLKEEVAKLKFENELLKKAAVFFAASS